MIKSKVLSILLLITVVVMFFGCIGPTNTELLFDYHNYPKAIEGFKPCADSEEKYEGAHGCSFNIGIAYFKNQQYPEAITYFKRADDLFKMKEKYLEYPKLYLHIKLGSDFWLGRAYFENKQYKEAIASFIKATSVAPENPETIYPMDSKYLRKYYLPLIPSKAACYFWLGEAYYYDTQYKGAAEAYKKSIELDPLKVYLYQKIAATYRKLKELDDALIMAKKAIEVKPTSLAYATLAGVYSDKRQYSEAITAYQTAQRMDPNNSDIPFEIGLNYMEIGEFDKAISSFDKAITLKTIIGIIYGIDEDYPIVKGLTEGPAKVAGIEIGDKLVQINGQSTKGWNAKMISQAIRETKGSSIAFLIERKNFKNPIQKQIERDRFLRRTSEIPPSTAFALRSLAYIMKGNTIEADKDAQEAYSLNPNNDSAKEALGAVYLDKGKYDDAIKILATTSKDDYFAHILEATAYAKTGGYKKAVEIYNTISGDYLISTSALRQSYKKAFLESMKPYIDAKKDSAKSLEASGQYKEALNEYVEALKVANDKEAKEIRFIIAKLIKEHPYLAELPEKARKHAMRAEASTKDGNFENAVKEYKEAIKIAPYFAMLYKAIALNYAELKEYQEAINNLNIYLDLMPDAPDNRAVKDQIYKWEFMLENEGSNGNKKQ